MIKGTEGENTDGIRECLVVGDDHPSTSGEPDHMRAHVDEDEVVPSVIQLVGEGLSDCDTSTTGAENDNVLLRRRGQHGEGSGRRAGVNIEQAAAYIGWAEETTL